MSTAPRIEPVRPPYEPAVAERLEAMMPPGVPPIGLFRTFVANLPMAQAMGEWGAYVLSKRLSLSMRDRELLIDRTTARCNCEYEWGVHIAFFAERVGLTGAQITSIAHGGPDDACWTDDRDRLLLRIADELHDTGTIGDAVHEAARAHLDDAQLLDVFFVCGWYHAISFAANGAGVALEDGAPTFASVT